MTDIQGWWRLVTTGIDVDQLPDSVKEHIASQINDGFTEGQIFEQGDEGSCSA